MLFNVKLVVLSATMHEIVCVWQAANSALFEDPCRYPGEIPRRQNMREVRCAQPRRSVGDHEISVSFSVILEPSPKISPPRRRSETQLIEDPRPTSRGIQYRSGTLQYEVYN